MNIPVRMQYGDSSTQRDSQDLYLQLGPILEKSVFCNIIFEKCFFPTVHFEVIQYNVYIQNYCFFTFLKSVELFSTIKNLLCHYFESYSLINNFLGTIIFNRNKKVKDIYLKDKKAFLYLDLI